MLFHQKLLKLRKENNLSQEALAENLGTTRQAVSKWENGQGYPETEKLLTIANLFDVSVDYLLKDTNEEAGNEDKGYYVSKEMAEGYLANQKRWVRRFVLGGAILILSIIAYLKYRNESASPLLFIGMVVVGGFLTLRGVISSDKRYQVLEKEQLLFDIKYLKELKAEYDKRRRVYMPVLIGSLVVFLVDIFILASDKGIFNNDLSPGVPAYLMLAVVVFALSAAALFYTGTMIESYEILTKNEERVQGVWFRILRKTKKKINSFLK